VKLHRSHPDGRFTIIPNDTLRDPRLSYLARAILAEALSHQGGEWPVTADELAARARKRRSGKHEGRLAIRAAFAELERCGYLRRVKRRRPDGCMVTDLHLYDVSAGHTDVPPTGTPVTGVSVTGVSVTGTSSRRRQEKTLSRLTLGQLLPPVHGLADDERDEFAAWIVKTHGARTPRPFLRGIPAGDYPELLAKYRADRGSTGGRAGRPPWCGECSDDIRRQLDTPGGVARCPKCHPLSVGRGMLESSQGRGITQ